MFISIEVIVIIIQPIWNGKLIRKQMLYCAQKLEQVSSTAQIYISRYLEGKWTAYKILLHLLNFQ